MLTNPELVRASKIASKLENELNLKCKKCGGEIAVAYDEQKATSDFVCTQCGKRIPEERLSEKTKEAMRRCVARR
jgi:RNA polymerase-binding transcription factor DksA